MTERMLNNTNWDKVQNDNGFIKRMRLIICKQRMMRECQVSFLDSETPLIPIVTDDNVMKQFADNQKEIMALCKQLGIDPMDKNLIEKVAKGGIGHGHEQKGHININTKHAKGQGTFDNLNGIEIVNNTDNDFQFKI